MSALFYSTKIMAIGGLLIALSQIFLQAAPIINIETVPVRNPNNPSDPTTGGRYGAVPYSFEIGKYDITIAQYTAFLNAVATNPNANPAITGLWIEEMGDPTEDTGALIERISNASNTAYTYRVVTDPTWKTSSGNRPICWVNWFDAARFANWMHNGGTKGADTENGAYLLVNYQTDGYVARKNSATWWIPSEDEWYKAAYFDPAKQANLPATDRYNNFATRSDALPWDSPMNPTTIGDTTSRATNSMANAASAAITARANAAITARAINSANYNWVRYALKGLNRPGVLTPTGYYAKSKSAYGTYDQCGLVWQWTEGVVRSSTQINRIVRGGSWGPGITPVSCYIRRDYPPGFYEDDDTGVRLARRAQ